MAQHILENVSYYSGQYNAEEYNLAINLWTQRDKFTYVEREPTILLEDYNRWYWNITHWYVLKAPTEPTEPVETIQVNPYTPGAPVERNVVSTLSNVTVN